MIAAGAGIAVAAAYNELVLDIRMPRASLQQSHAVGTNISMKLSQLQRASETVKTKYGPGAEAGITNPPARIVTLVGNKVVEESRPQSELADVIGLFVVGPPGHPDSTFPFRIDPRKPPARGTKAEPGARQLKNRFGKSFPAESLDFDDRNAATDRCITLLPTELGGPGKLLKVELGTFCVVSWRGAERRSMLVGVTLADGDPWMRPFTRRVCRWLASAALARLAATGHEPLPDYAGCILVDRPGREGASQSLRSHVYEVRRDASLAYIE